MSTPNETIDLGESSLTAGEEIDLDESSLTAAKPSDWQQKKASHAFLIALLIVGTFSAVILLTLLMTVGILWKTGDPTRVGIFADAIVSVYESLGKFVAAVFGSLLAFILGYYYSKEQNT